MKDKNVCKKCLCYACDDEECMRCIACNDDKLFLDKNDKEPCEQYQEIGNN